MVIGRIKTIGNMDTPKVIRYKFTPESIKRFYVKDKRIGTPRFTKEMDGLKEAILNMGDDPKTEWYPERYDLTVFTYDQNVDEPYLIIDGSHRLVALKELFENKKLEHFDTILIPSNLLYFGMTPSEMLEMNRKLDRELKKEGIPIWVKKYDYDEEALECVDGKIKVYSRKNIWVNKKLIDSGGKNNKRMTIEEYEATRQKQ